MSKGPPDPAQVQLVVANNLTLMNKHLRAMRHDELLRDPAYDDPKRLERHGFKVYSQNEEDGLLHEIFRRLGIERGRFFEIGLETGIECNTLFLLLQGWSGTWIEAHPPYVAQIQAGHQHAIADGRLRVVQSMATRENIDTLLVEAFGGNDPDLVSIDVDGVDYYLLEAIQSVRPKVIVVEYNAKLAPPLDLTIPYNPDFRWDISDYFGASLVALTRLAERKGYRLVGCNLFGANAFFVRDDVAGDLFASPATAAHLYQPARYELNKLYECGHPPRAGHWVSSDEASGLTLPK